MRKIMLALALGGAAIAFGSVEASARDYPYCFVSRSTGSPGDCSYLSYQQCQVSASGRGGSCYINPRTAFARQGYHVNNFDPAEAYVAPPRRYRRQPQYQYYAPY